MDKYLTFDVPESPKVLSTIEEEQKADASSGEGSAASESPRGDYEPLTPDSLSDADGDGEAPASVEDYSATGAVAVNDEATVATPKSGQETSEKVAYFDQEGVTPLGSVSFQSPLLAAAAAAAANSSSTAKDSPINSPLSADDNDEHNISPVPISDDEEDTVDGESTTVAHAVHISPDLDVERPDGDQDESHSTAARADQVPTSLPVTRTEEDPQSVLDDSLSSTARDADASPSAAQVNPDHQVASAPTTIQNAASGGDSVASQESNQTANVQSTTQTPAPVKAESEAEPSPVAMPDDWSRHEFGDLGDGDDSESGEDGEDGGLADASSSLNLSTSLHISFGSIGGEDNHEAPSSTHQPQGNDEDNQHSPWPQVVLADENDADVLLPGGFDRSENLSEIFTLQPVDVDTPKANNDKDKDTEATSSPDPAGPNDTSLNQIHAMFGTDPNADAGTGNSAVLREEDLTTSFGQPMDLSALDADLQKHQLTPDPQMKWAGAEAIESDEFAKAHQGADELAAFFAERSYPLHDSAALAAIFEEDTFMNLGSLGENTVLPTPQSAHRVKHPVPGSLTKKKPAETELGRNGAEPESALGSNDSTVLADTSAAPVESPDVTGPPTDMVTPPTRSATLQSAIPPTPGSLRGDLTYTPRMTELTTPALEKLEKKFRTGAKKAPYPRFSKNWEAVTDGGASDSPAQIRDSIVNQTMDDIEATLRLSTRKPAKRRVPQVQDVAAKRHVRFSEESSSDGPHKRLGPFTPAPTQYSPTSRKIEVIRQIAALSAPCTPSQLVSDIDRSLKKKIQRPEPLDGTFQADRRESPFSSSQAKRRLELSPPDQSTESAEGQLQSNPGASFLQLLQERSEAALSVLHTDPPHSVQEDLASLNTRSPNGARAMDTSTSNPSLEPDAAATMSSQKPESILLAWEAEESRRRAVEQGDGDGSVPSTASPNPQKRPVTQSASTSSDVDSPKSFMFPSPLVSRIYLPHSIRLANDVSAGDLKTPLGHAYLTIRNTNQQESLDNFLGPHGLESGQLVCSFEVSPLPSFAYSNTSPESEVGLGVPSRLTWRIESSQPTILPVDKDVVVRVTAENTHHSARDHRSMLIERVKAALPSDVRQGDVSIVHRSIVRVIFWVEASSGTRLKIGESDVQAAFELPILSDAPVHRAPSNELKAQTKPASKPAAADVQIPKNMRSLVFGACNYPDTAQTWRHQRLALRRLKKSNSKPSSTARGSVSDHHLYCKQLPLRNCGRHATSVRLKIVPIVGSANSSATVNPWSVTPTQCTLRPDGGLQNVSVKFDHFIGQQLRDFGGPPNAKLVILTSNGQFYYVNLSLTEAYRRQFGRRVERGHPAIHHHHRDHQVAHAAGHQPLSSSRDTNQAVEEAVQAARYAEKSAQIQSISADSDKLIECSTTTIVCNSWTTSGDRSCVRKVRIRRAAAFRGCTMRIRAHIQSFRCIDGLATVPRQVLEIVGADGAGEQELVFRSGDPSVSADNLTHTIRVKFDPTNLAAKSVEAKLVITALFDGSGIPNSGIRKSYCVKIVGHVRRSAVTLVPESSKTDQTHALTVAQRTMGRLLILRNIQRDRFSARVHASFVVRNDGASAVFAHISTSNETADVERKSAHWTPTEPTLANDVVDLHVVPESFVIQPESEVVCKVSLPIEHHNGPALHLAGLLHIVTVYESWRQQRRCLRSRRNCGEDVLDVVQEADNGAPSDEPVAGFSEKEFVTHLKHNFVYVGVQSPASR